MTICTPNESEPCDHYDGTPGTEGHGLCVLGTMRCNPEGTAYGACDDQVIDVAEVCGDGLDQDCDGISDDGCACMPNSTAVCYSGPAVNQGVGACVEGTQTCNPQGTSYGMCTGDVLPATEDCATAEDENCNGREPMNGGVDNLAGCECIGAQTKPCYTGPATTADVGKCKSGTATCMSGFYNAACPGEILPATEVCAASSGDEDCNGLSCSEPKWLINRGDTEYQYSDDVAVDPAGNVYWVGSFKSTITLGTNLISAGGYDIFVSKWSSAGSLLWAKRFGGSANEFALSVAADANNVYVQSSVGVDFGGGTAKQIAKLNGTTGNHVWSRGCTQPFWANAIGAQTSGGIAVDGNGNVIVGATFSGTTISCDGGASMPGNTNADNAGLIVKFGPSGTYGFGRTYVDPLGYRLEVNGVAVDSSGSIWFTGQDYKLSTFGCASTLGVTQSGAFLVKTDASGNCSFQKKYDTNSHGYDVAVDTLGSPILVGDFTGTINLTGANVTASGAFGDAFYVKLNAAGTTQWGGTLVAGQGRDVDTDSADNVVLGAQSNFLGVVHKLAKTTGATLWTTSFSSGAPPSGIAVGGPQNLIFAAGSYSTKSATFGDFTVMNADQNTQSFSTDAFLVRVDP